MNVLVTGATGFIGSHLCRALVGKGYKVYGLSTGGNSKRIKDIKGNEHFSLLKVDITNEALLREALDNITVDVIFHLASKQPGKDSDFESFVEINTIGTYNLLEFAELANVKLFIYSSTTVICGNTTKGFINETCHVLPNNYYSLTKYTGEVLCRIFSKRTPFKCIVLRYPSVFGVGHEDGIVYTYWKLAKHNKPIEVFSRGELYRNVIHVSDVIKANPLVVEKQNLLPKFGLFVIGSKNSMKMIDIAKFIVKELGSKSQVIPVDIPAQAPIHSILDISRSKEKLFLEPMTIEEGLKIYIKEMEPGDD